MNKLKRLSISLTALLLFSGVAMVLPVSARPAAADDTSTSSATDNTALVQLLREQAKLKNQVIRENAKEQTQAHREQACSARKANLTTRMTNAVKHANNLKGVMDRMFTKLQAFYTAKNLNVPNYDNLKTAVETAQTASQTSINALSSLDVSVDCSSQTVADSVSAFQTAVTTTRDSLKAYRKALVALITSLKGASTGANSSTGSTDNSTNSTGQ